MSKLLKLRFVIDEQFSNILYIDTTFEVFQPVKLTDLSDVQPENIEFVYSKFFVFQLLRLMSVRDLQSSNILEALDNFGTVQLFILMVLRLVHPLNMLEVESTIDVSKPLKSKLVNFALLANMYDKSVVELVSKFANVIDLSDGKP